MAATSGGTTSSSPELPQQLAALAADAGALLLVSQRVTTDVSWRSLRVSGLIERPG